MFCPAGYQIFKRVDDVLSRWTRDSLPDVPLPEPTGELSAEAAIELWQKLEQLAESRRHRLRWLRNEFFETCPSLSLASPSGTVLRIASEIGLYADEPQRDQNSYVYLSDQTWLVEAARSIARSTAAAALYGKITDEEISRFATSTVSYDDPDFFDFSNIVAVKNAMTFAVILQQFDGWALCVRAEDVPTDPAAFSIEIPDQPNASSHEELPPEKMVEAIVAEFDQGNLIIRDEARQRWAAGMKHEAWLKVWRSVTFQRPELARPGPKRSLRLGA